ncbi:hypothetical protein BDZ85DRAFT_103672 [Elsinoe ampelina]|uniref:Uncharacterized protein n=1 Tax=Elsinoe ampelina TaxID=302913 RepID=A0A6A6GFP1_9PEZI|nr:hypothetical protein BDZ85DRAFT_103672 [Elsinoe ampelina]
MRQVQVACCDDVISCIPSFPYPISNLAIYTWVEAHLSSSFKNESDRYIAFVGPSTLSSLDGTTQTVTDGNITTVKTSESGGTDGLFTALSFVAANGPDSSKNVPFTVWATMPASSGSTVDVKLIDATTLINNDLDRLRVNGWADNIYKNVGSWGTNNFERSKLVITMGYLTTSPDNVTDWSGEDQLRVSQLVLQVAY